MYKFKIGDKVYKPKGYKFPGTVVSVFRTTSDEIRVVAELEDNGMLHIFSESQLELQEKVATPETLFNYVTKSDDLVPYHSVCGCTTCNCIMGKKMVPNPAKYGEYKSSIDTTTSTKSFRELGILDRFENLSTDRFHNEEIKPF